MRSNKITAGQWNRKTDTGFVRGKRISLRARKRLYKKLLDARLSEQLLAGAKALTDTLDRTEV